MKNVNKRLRKEKEQSELNYVSNTAGVLREIEAAYIFRYLDSSLFLLARPVTVLLIFVFFVYVNNFVEDDVNIRRGQMNGLHLCQKVQIIHFR
jgi:hypothetical protein